MIKRKTTLYVKPRPTGRRTAPSGGRQPIALSMALIALVGAGLSVTLLKVYLEQRALRMGYEWTQARNELKEVLKEQDNLLMDKAKYTDADYILPRAVEMGLRAALPGQVRHMWEPADAESERNAMMLANQTR